MATKLTPIERMRWLDIAIKLNEALARKGVCRHVDTLSFAQACVTLEDFEAHCKFYMKHLREDATAYAVDLTPYNTTIIPFKRNSRN